MINGPRRSRIGPKLTEIRASKVGKTRKTYGVSWTQVALNVVGDRVGCDVMAAAKLVGANANAHAADDGPTPKRPRARRARPRDPRSEDGAYFRDFQTKVDRPTKRQRSLLDTKNAPP